MPGERKWGAFDIIFLFVAVWCLNQFHFLFVADIEDSGGRKIIRRSKTNSSFTTVAPTTSGPPATTAVLVTSPPPTTTVTTVTSNGSTSTESGSQLPSSSPASTSFLSRRGGSVRRIPLEVAVARRIADRARALERAFFGNTTFVF